ncbi:MAG: TrkH family potassium uptake protein [Nocardiopsis sp. BM-2018]|nr:MAG: TrkH family potassium uptake protein [Nocardiopsis sp. BM-2018]
MPQGRRGRFAPYVVGTGLLGLAVALVAFAVYAAIVGDPPVPFLVTALVAATLGLPTRLYGRSGQEPSRREALIGVLLLWSTVPAVGVLPYVLGAGMSPLNALFESMSGFTATGATAISDFAAVNASLFMWRAFTQWVGGIGIVVVFVAVFPQLAIAGRQIFNAELPGPTEERIAPRLRTTALAVLALYVGLSATCAFAYVLAGMEPYAAVAHAFTTVAAAGFSPEARSFEAYGAAVDWVAITFMTLAAVNFTLLFRAFMGRPRDLARDPELRTYVAIVLLAGSLLSFHLIGTYEGAEALRHGFFHTVSILTTTGYASADFGAWPDAARATLLLLMFVGGSAGSAAGGIKVMRWLVLGAHTVREVRRALHPRAVLPLAVGRRAIPEDVLRAIGAFLMLYVALVIGSATLLVYLGTDFLSAFSAAAATVGNVGPGLGVVGPMGSYDALPAAGRAVLIFNMFAGRLEVVTVFVLFTFRWWRLPRRTERGPRREAAGDRG